MRMRPMQWIAGLMVLCLSVDFVAWAGEVDEYKEKSAKLAELLKEIRTVLPKRWQAEINRKGVPSIEVIRNEGLPNEFVGASDIFSLRRIEEDKRIVKPKFHLRYEKYLTQEEYATEVLRNEEKQSSRLQMRGKLLERKIKYEVSKDPNIPIYPDRFLPKNDLERELVLQYALLWEDTEPVYLPTHHWQGMSFKYYSQRFVYFGDGKEGEEVESVIKDVLGVLTAYEDPMKSRTETRKTGKAEGGTGKEKKPDSGKTEQGGSKPNRP